MATRPTRGSNVRLIKSTDTRKTADKDALPAADVLHNERLSLSDTSYRELTSIGFHAETLVKLGVSRQALEEALGLCVYMGGGPSLMYAAKALQAFEEFGGPAQPAA